MRESINGKQLWVKVWIGGGGAVKLGRVVMTAATGEMSLIWSNLNMLAHLS